VRLQRVPHRGHVESPQQLALDQAVEPVARRVVLGGGRPRDDVGVQLGISEYPVGCDSVTSI
jgi:hypothetical protein